MDEIKKPDLPEEELSESLEFLDDLRESGATNMFGATPYLIEWYNDMYPYPISISTAKSVLTYWMKTFSERQSQIQKE